MSNAKGHIQTTVYFPADMMAEIQAEAERQERSASWIVQQAWMRGKSQVYKLMPGGPEIPPITQPGPIRVGKAKPHVHCDECAPEWGCWDGRSLCQKAPITPER